MSNRPLIASAYARYWAACRGRMTPPAMTVSVLRMVTARGSRHDLPATSEQTVPSEPRPPARAGPPGVLPFSRRLVVPRDRQATRGLVLEKLAPPLNEYGYGLVSKSHDYLLFENRQRPGWTYVVAVLLFPIGLLALIHKPERVSISLEEHAEGQTKMIVQGEARRKVRKAFAGLTLD